MRERVFRNDLDELEFEIYLDQISKKLFDDLTTSTQLFFELNYKKLKEFIIDCFMNNNIDLKEYGFKSYEEFKIIKKDIKYRLKKILKKDLGGD
jgi:hypothetical protein